MFNVGTYLWNYAWRGCWQWAHTVEKFCPQNVNWVCDWQSWNRTEWMNSIQVCTWIIPFKRLIARALWLILIYFEIGQDLCVQWTMIKVQDWGSFSVHSTFYDNENWSFEFFWEREHLLFDHLPGIKIVKNLEERR